MVNHCAELLGEKVCGVLRKELADNFLCLFNVSLCAFIKSCEVSIEHIVENTVGSVNTEVIGADINGNNVSVLYEFLILCTKTCKAVLVSHIEPVLTGCACETPLGVLVTVVIVIKKNVKLFCTHRADSKLLEVDSFACHFSKSLCNECRISIFGLSLVSVSRSFELAYRVIVELFGEISHQAEAVCIGCTESNVAELVFLDVFKCKRTCEGCTNTQHECK